MIKIAKNLFKRKKLSEVEIKKFENSTSDIEILSVIESFIKSQTIINRNVSNLIYINKYFGQCYINIDVSETNNISIRLDENRKVLFERLLILNTFSAFGIEDEKNKEEIKL